MAPVDQPPPINCSIIRRESGNRVQLRGRLTSREAAQGHYSFRVHESGPSGSSNVNQDGPFSAPANTETLVGSASFNLAPNIQLTARLSLQAGGRVYNCEQSDGGSR